MFKVVRLRHSYCSDRDWWVRDLFGGFYWMTRVCIFPRWEHGPTGLLSLCPPGAVYLDDCPVQPYIPIYLIVSGVFGLMLAVLSCLPCSQKPEDGTSNPLSTACVTWNSLTTSFLFCWFIAGELEVAVGRGMSRHVGYLTSFNRGAPVGETTHCSNMNDPLDVHLEFKLAPHTFVQLQSCTPLFEIFCFDFLITEMTWMNKWRVELHWLFWGITKQYRV